MNKPDLRIWAKIFLARIKLAERKAKQDQRSNPSYWSAGDPWGPSIYDFKDAEDYIDNEIIDCILENAIPKAKP